CLLRGLIYISMDIIGIPGNLIIIFAFLHTFHAHGRVTTGEVILSKLAFSNLLVIFTWGFPITLQAIGIYKVYGDLSCQISLYFYCVGRAMSISITSLLGCFQCISIAPSNQRWMSAKKKILDHLYTIMLFIWTFNLIISSTRLAYSTSSLRNSTSRYIMSYNFCFVIFPNNVLYLGNGVIYVVRDLFFLSLMMLSSGYLLYVFNQHGKQVKCILSLKTKHAEIRAAKAVFTLMMMYIVSFGLDNMFWILTLCTFPLSPRFTDARIFFDSCYSAISPVVIILTNKKIQMGLQCSKKKKDFQAVKSLSNKEAPTTICTHPADAGRSTASPVADIEIEDVSVELHQDEEDMGVAGAAEEVDNEDSDGDMVCLNKSPVETVVVHGMRKPIVMPGQNTKKTTSSEWNYFFINPDNRC
ncbi:olfactory receptor class A-like protein 1, partial [Pseudophryne corroboree]|uniref:olfactory receptor class A-like protein 1 n=1 Tax=Pseudophryne corroboree TaxID=495146 RepID=UPI003081E119